MFTYSAFTVLQGARPKIAPRDLGPRYIHRLKLAIPCANFPTIADKTGFADGAK
jgi:hypothetical protein